MIPEISTGSSRYQPHIDGLRAIAVLVVLFFHLGISSFDGGFVGVDVFFVISGFLITGLLKTELDQTGSIRFGRFYQRRVRRLFPALFVVLAGTTIVSILLLSPSVLVRFGTSLSYAIVGLSNFVFWFEADYFDLSAQLKPLLHTWSLSVEEQFYLLWPSSLLLCYKLGAKRILPLLMIVAALVSLSLNSVFADGHVSLISSHAPFLAEYVANPKSTLYFLLPFRVFEFVIGALLVWLPNIQRHNWLNCDLVLWAGFTMIAYAVVGFDEDMLFPSFTGLVPCLGTAMVIYAGGQALTGGVLTNRVFVVIGKISYSLYLIHWPVIVFWQYVTERLTFLDQVLICAFSIGAAYLSHRYIETPFRKQSINASPSLRTLATLGALLCMMTLGMQMKQQRGWPERAQSVAHINLLESTEEFHHKNYGGSGYPRNGSVGGEHSAPDIVLMGDSHGRQYAEGLFEELAGPENLSLRVVSLASCLHLPRFTRTTHDGDWDHLCPASYEAALNAVRTAETPPLVVLSHSWKNQMGRADLLDENGRRRNKLVDSKDIIAGLIGLKKEIGGAILLVIGNVPTTNGVDLYDELTRPRLLVMLQDDDDTSTSSWLSADVRRINQILKQAAKDTGAFEFADPADALCDDDLCMNIDWESQRLIYSDSSHLSKHGSRVVIRHFLPEIRNLLFSKEHKGSHSDNQNFAVRSKSANLQRNVY